MNLIMFAKLGFQTYLHIDLKYIRCFANLNRHLLSTLKSGTGTVQVRPAPIKFLFSQPTNDSSPSANLAPARLDPWNQGVSHPQ